MPLAQKNIVSEKEPDQAVDEIINSQFVRSGNLKVITDLIRIVFSKIINSTEILEVSGRREALFEAQQGFQSGHSS
jgi:hypothetical protein